MKCAWVGNCHNVAAQTTGLLSFFSSMHFYSCCWNRFRVLLLVCLLIFVFGWADSPVMAITAPELRVKQINQDLPMDMHGFDLKEQDFLKVDLNGVDLSGADLRGAVFNSSQLQEANLQGADLENVVAFASIFDRADLRGANFTNAMLMQSRFKDALIDGADFSNAVLDLRQQKELCARAEGTNAVSGLSTRDSLGCRS
ncbi:MAG: pentapeptide repeat-containing protein [Prochlorococcaceae cyanobacterium ETNP7_MAG_30]|jgi:uncharacterized protein YjbI with pentapeptide repeats|nr:pentapeptide repeat-containing protein [Prochlorococcaceae cyanobacterium ETNP7_MAG_30]|tara:strand:+ start:343 stop:939 length:597 start_codon:yes stop_codon:yes gene_type:complete